MRVAFTLLIILNVISGRAQSESLVSIIRIEDNVKVRDTDIIKEIVIKRKLLKKSKNDLIKQAIDSTRHYNANCFHITYYDESESTNMEGWSLKWPPYLKGYIYKLDSVENIALYDRLNKAQYQRDSIVINRKTTKSFELELGGQVSNFELKNNSGYIRSEGLENGGYVNFYFHLNYVKTINTKRNLNARLGIGLAREYLYFNPLVSLKEAGVSELDSITIAEIGNWEYQFLVPLSITYELPNIIKIGYGIRFYAGIENRFRIYRSGLDNVMVENYNVETNEGPIYSDMEFSKKINEKYSTHIKSFSVQANFGIALLTPKMISGGIRINRIILPPFNNNQKLSTHFGMTVFINAPLFNL
jgi:hypothetical protein